MLNLITDLFLRKRKSSKPGKLNAATAKKVLQFLSYGLIYGIESLADKYPQKSKVSEFIAVCGAILGGLKPDRDGSGLTDAVLISVHVNDMQKEIRFMQVGEHVMLALDGCETIISFTTLDQIYISLRNDIIRHGAIFGKSLHAIAMSYPA